MQKHFYMVKDVLSFEKFVLLGREIISLQTISNVFEITQQQNSIKSSRVHIHTYIHTYRVIQNDCQGFNNLSYTIHLRQEYMYFSI